MWGAKSGSGEGLELDPRKKTTLIDGTARERPGMPTVLRRQGEEEAVSLNSNLPGMNPVPGVKGRAEGG